MTAPPVELLTTDPAAELPERIRSKIEFTDSCWLWTAARFRLGYGQVRWTNGTASAHRVVYQLLAGPIPEGAELDHLCSVRHCVNPAHLEPVDHRTNMYRSDRHFGTINARKTHCPRGHPYDEANTLSWRSGKRRSRQCRTCHRARSVEYSRRRRAAIRLTGEVPR